MERRNTNTNGGGGDGAAARRRRRATRRRLLPLAAAAAAAATVLGGCHTDMWHQPKIRPQQESDFFADGQASRPTVPHTVPRDTLRTDDALYTGIVNRQFVTEFPFPVTKQVLLRGQERFNAFCSPCHSRVGDGNGMIAQRGLSLRRKPASYHTDRLRNMPVGHFYDVITNGYGVMYSYANRVQDPSDRWAIVAYIRALQRSQSAPAAALTPAQIQELNAGAAAGAQAPRTRLGTFGDAQDRTGSETGGGPQAGGAESGAGSDGRGRQLEPVGEATGSRLDPSRGGAGAEGNTNRGEGRGSSISGGGGGAAAGTSPPAAPPAAGGGTNDGQQ